MRISVGDVTLYFDVDGAALRPDGDAMTERPTPLLLHGGRGADHSLFKPEFDALADRCQIVYPDQRGSGRSDPGTPDTWTRYRWADDVAAVCAGLGIARTVLVGTSSGALVALNCAARRLAETLTAAPVTPEVLPGIGHGAFRQATEQAFAHVRRFLGGDPVLPIMRG